MRFKENVEEEVHAVAGLLKLFLRSLPEPLFTYEKYSAIIQAQGNRKLISKLFIQLHDRPANSHEYRECLASQKPAPVGIFIQISACCYGSF